MSITQPHLRTFSDTDVCIWIDRVGMTYMDNGKTVEAVRRVELYVPYEEFVSIIGPTGCGKTTLLRIVGGLIAPTKGEIRIGGRPINEPTERVGMVFQRPSLLPWLSVEQNLHFPLKLLRRSTASKTKQIELLLHETGLSQFRRAYPRELSIGMQQLTAFARSLVLDVEVMLMDEPFSALDAITREKLCRKLLEVWSVHRKTVLFVTHTIPEAVYLGDHVVVLSPRPASIVDTFRINLPRPRSLEVMKSPEFFKITTEIRESLQMGEKI